MPQSVVGVPHVIAVCPEDLDISKVPEDTDSVLLRFTSSDEACLASAIVSAMHAST